VVPEGDVVGVFDLDNASTAKDTRDFLALAQKRGEVVSVAPDLPKSFAVCGRAGRQSVYILQVASSTLKKRADGGEFLPGQ